MAFITNTDQLKDSFNSYDFLKLPDEGDTIVYIGESILPIHKDGTTYDPVKHIGVPDTEFTGGMIGYSQVWGNIKGEDGKEKPFSVRVFPEIKDDPVTAFVSKNRSLFQKDGKPTNKYRIMAYIREGETLKPVIWEFNADVGKKLLALVTGEDHPIDNEESHGSKVRVTRTKNGKKFMGKEMSDTNITVLKGRVDVSELPETEMDKYSGLSAKTPEESLDYLRKLGFKVD